MKLLSSLLALGLTIAGVQAQSVLIDITKYGWMDQYSMNTRHNLVGNDACVPTSTTNALTFLQNFYPAIYDTTLSGSGYTAWQSTDDSLISYMGTQANVGTYDTQFVYGLQNYLTNINAAPVYMSGVFFDAGWGGSYPKPAFITEGHPTISFLLDALGVNSALITTISYFGGGGHGILVNGVTWDSISNTGTLAFVDPLNPSQNYSGTTPTGGTLQTTGLLSLDTSGNLKLTYDQYQGGLPFSPSDFATVEAVIDGALALNPVPEPAPITLLALGGFSVVLLAVRRKRHV